MRRSDRFRFAARELSRYYHPEFGWYSAEPRGADPEWNGWLGAVKWLGRCLQRRLSFAELTVLSASIGSGNAPLLDDGEKSKVWSALKHPSPPDDVLAELEKLEDEDSPYKG